VAAAGGAGRATRNVADATHDLYRQYGKQIYAYCLHQLRSREEAEDAVQTTFLNAFRGLQRGTTTRFEQAWLYKIAQNVCIARRSSSGRRLKLEAPDDFEILQEVVPSGGTPADGDILELMGLEDALDTMPENQRRAILLREWQGLSYHEIATQLGLSQGAVEMLIFRARRTLAMALEQPDVAEKRRIGKAKTGFSFGSLVAAMKSLFSAGAALKMAAVAVSAAVVGTNAVHTILHKTFAVRAARPAAAPVVPTPVVAVTSVLTTHRVQRTSYRVKPHIASALLVRTSPSVHSAPVVAGDVAAPPAQESTTTGSPAPAAAATSQPVPDVVVNVPPTPPPPAPAASTSTHAATTVGGAATRSPSDETTSTVGSSTYNGTRGSSTDTTTSTVLGTTGTNAEHDGRGGNSTAPTVDGSGSSQTGDATSGGTTGTGDTTTTTTTTTTTPDTGQNGTPPSAPAGSTDTSTTPPASPSTPPATDGSGDTGSSGSVDSGSTRGGHGHDNGGGGGHGHDH